jgi:HK97 family phage major capsid protein
LVNAVHTVAPGYRDQGGAWVMSDSALKALRNVKDTAGAAVLIPPFLPGQRPMLLGYEVYIDENMPTTGANNKSAAFAGWQAAYVVRRVNGVSLQRQVEVFSNTGQLGYRAAHRVDGRVLISTAGVALAHSAT